MRWAQISDKISRFNKKRRRIWQWGVFWFQIRPWLNQQKVLDWSFWGVRVVTVKKGHEKIRADMENKISTLVVIRSLILEGRSNKMLLRGSLLFFFPSLILSDMGNLKRDGAEAQYCMKRDVRTQSLSQPRKCAARKINGTPYHTSWSWDECTRNFTQKRDKLNRFNLLLKHFLWPLKRS